MLRKFERKSLIDYGVFRVGAVVMAGSLALASCGSGGENANRNSNITSILPPSETQLNTSTITSSEPNVILVFDDLNGGSSIIQVFPGVTKASADFQSNGTFNDGDKVIAECKTEGRTISSDPDVGEIDRSSSEWFRIHGAPGVTQYATAVYVENPDVLQGQLPDC